MASAGAKKGPAPVETPKVTTKEVAKPVPAGVPGLPAALAGKMAADAGKGVSASREDNIVPLIYILQPLSPQVMPKNPKQIPGAVAGSIWLRNSLKPIVDGELGILFQPCFFKKVWNEWKPRDEGGGFIGRHEWVEPEPGKVASPPAELEAHKVVDPKNPNKVRWMTEGGTELIETREHYGIVYGGAGGLKDHPGLVMPYMVAMSSTGHGASRAWMSLMNQFTLPSGGVAASYARRYFLKLALRKNTQGEWFMWTAEDGGWVTTVEDYERGAALYLSMERGELKPEAPSEQEVDEGETGEDAARRAGV